ncbi:MAG: DinB family protein [Planctomycetes bacterium]|nr:DinB family protein [Planctomycetota bacterium]
MKFHLDSAIEILERTPAALRAMLGGLSEPWVTSNYGHDTFSPFDVVGHLIHGERTDWMPRARMILEHGESKTFEPFDRYAMYEQSKGRTIGELLDEFESLRCENVIALRGLALTPEDLARRGTHPELGAVTLENLLATWTVHDLNHIHQIAKSMGHQLRNSVGPWIEYISFLPK